MRSNIGLGLFNLFHLRRAIKSSGLTSGHFCTILVLRPERWANSQLILGLLPEQEWIRRVAPEQEVVREEERQQENRNIKIG